MKKGDLSSDMLISLSMGHQNQQNQTHLELTQNLQLNNIISHPLAVDAFQVLDRRLFDVKEGKQQNTSAQTLYNNNILKLSNNQNMTTPMMHGIAIENLAKNIEKLSKRIGTGSSQKYPLYMLDIGSGRGYITFALAHMLQQMDMVGTVMGIDIFKTLKLDSEFIMKTIFDKQILRENKNLKIEFQSISLQNLIERYSNQKSCYKDSLHLIHSGLALETAQINEIKSFVMNNDNSFFLYPHIHEDGEQSYINLVQNVGSLEQQDIMKCVFTRIQNSIEVQKNQEDEQDLLHKQQEVISKQGKDNISEDISKFFIQNDKDLEYNSLNEEEQEKKENNQDGNYMKEFEISLMKNQIRELQSQLQENQDFVRNWSSNFKQKNQNKQPSLQDMAKDSKMQVSLQNIRKLTQKIEKLKKGVELQK